MFRKIHRIYKNCSDAVTCNAVDLYTKTWWLVESYFKLKWGVSCPWWRLQMETFSALLALCAANSPATDEFPHKRQWHGALVLSLICVWINRWINNREAWWFETPSRSLWSHCYEKRVSGTGTSNYILQYLWDVITCPCPWDLLLAQHYHRS